jgi:tight adherence protein B
VRVLAVALAAAAAAIGVGGRRDLILTRLAVIAQSGGARSDRQDRWGLRTVLARFPVVPSVTARSTRTRNIEVAVAEACLLLAAELRSGAHPRHALSVVAAEWPDLFGAAARWANVGADVASALREQASIPGRSALSAVAAGWELSERTGAALSEVLTAVADSLRAAGAARREAEAELSSVRVTVRLLALLPIGTLLLLSGEDAQALRFLIGAPLGIACLGGAIVLVAVGLRWIDRLARSTTTSTWS